MGSEEQEGTGEVRDVILFIIVLFIGLGAIVYVIAVKGDDCQPCNISNPYHLSERTKIFVLTGDDTVVVYKGQPYYFNEPENNKTSKTRRP